MRLLLVVVAALWGLQFVANHELLVTLDPVQLVTLRYTIVALVFIPVLFFRASSRPRLSRREWGLVLGSAVTAVPLSQLPVSQGYHFLSPALISVLVSTAPGFVALMAVLFLHERVSGLQVTGLLVALAGAGTVVLFATGQGSELAVSNPLGAAIVLLTPLFWAAYTVISKPLAVAHGPMNAVGLALIVGAALLSPFLPHALADVGELTATQWWWMAYLVVPGTIVTYIVWFAALRKLSATATGATMYLVPVFALGWSALILSERPTPVGLFGTMLILVGVALTQFAPKRASIPLPEPLEVPY